MTNMDTLVGRGAVEELTRALAGDVIAPGDPRYEPARRVWNGAIDRRPVLIARCASPRDVVEAVRFARSERLPIAVRGGGHNVAGLGTCDDGLVIDLAGLRGVEIDAEARTARVQGGALWADVDAAAQEFGLGTTGGLISSTGVGGLTLGGGIGWLARKHGLACDNLLAAELVTAEATVATASATENPELFWALRGGGGNFGVVTEFTVRLHPVGTVLGGMIAVALDDAAGFLRGFRALTLPDELTVMFNLMTVPPAPDFPPELHGRQVLIAVVCYAGELDEGERGIAPLRTLAPALFEHLGPMPYAAFQQLMDAGAPAGVGNYWKPGYLTGLDDRTIDILVARSAEIPTPMSQLHVYQLGGAIARVNQDATAYLQREAPYVFSVLAVWPDPTEDATPYVEWARAVGGELAPYAAPGAYVNFIGEDGSVRDAYGSHYERLAAVKAAWDPTNLFHLNHNIAPS